MLLSITDLTNSYVLKNKKQILHKLMCMFFNINKHNMILAIT